MTADNKFKRYMKTLIVLFLIVFCYVIIADRQVPLTTEGRVHGHVVQVAPEVTSRVVDVLVRNNQKVVQGDKLFKLDDRQFVIALEKAKLSLRSAHEKERALYAQRKVAKANIARARATYDNASAEYLRIKTLSKQNLTSKSHLDSALKQYQIAIASLEVELQSLQVIEAELRSGKGESTQVLLARNQVENARLALDNTLVQAPSDGVVTNLRLEVGTMANANMPLLTFIPKNAMWVAADFREKAVTRVDDNFKALVTFDAYPGRVFGFSVDSRDYGVADVQQQANGTLTEIEVNNRWVRDAQRTRINLENNEELPSSLFVGSRATLVLYSGNSTFWKMMARVQIRLVSWFHFIY